MDLRQADAPIGFCRSIVAIPQFALDFDVSALLQGTGPVGEFVPAKDAVPFRARLVLVAAFLFPADTSSE